MIIEKIKQEIKKVDKPENKLDYQKFFKEPLDVPVRIKTAVLRKVSNKCFKEVKNLSKNEILDICDKILETDIIYKRFFAFEWISKLTDDYEKSDFNRFEKWLNNYVDNWGSCDHLCSSIGRLINKFPELSPKRKKWTKSKNLWLRRASAVSLIAPVLNGQLLHDVFETADILMMDEEDLVQKGYGWMLKEAGNRFPEKVFAYVMKHNNKMPRTALRYAIEKYPQDKRKKALGK